jgi:hypothetical protein
VLGNCDNTIVGCFYQSAKQPVPHADFITIDPLSIGELPQKSYKRFFDF